MIGKPGKILRAWVIQKVLGDVRSDLRKTKMEQGVFDYEDLLHLVEEQVNPEGNSTTPTALTKVVREKYACAVVDEFQDTDYRQWNIFRKISDHLIHTMLSASSQIIQNFAACFGLPVFFQKL